MQPADSADSPSNPATSEFEVIRPSYELGFTPAVAEAWHKVARAWFGERQSVLDIDALVDLATKMGLDPVPVRDALEKRQYRGVEIDASEARHLGASGEPLFVIERRYSVMGAQGIDVLCGPDRCGVSAT